MFAPGQPPPLPPAFECRLTYRSAAELHVSARWIGDGECWPKAEVHCRSRVRLTSAGEPPKPDIAIHRDSPGAEAHARCRRPSKAFHRSPPAEPPAANSSKGAIAYASGQGRSCGWLGGRLGAGGFPVPGQQIGDPFGGVVCDAGEDVGEPGFGVDVVQGAGFDEGVDRSGATTA
jgi:hypothetical protein